MTYNVFGGTLNIAQLNSTIHVIQNPKPLHLGNANMTVELVNIY